MLDTKPRYPLYEQLLSAHVSCLRIATPVDQLPRIDAQLAQSQHVVTKYLGLGGQGGNLGDDKELDQFMTHYVLLLCSFKEQLQHVRVHAMEAVMVCWEIEQSLQSLTGVSPGEGTGAIMSDDDDDDDQVDSDANLFDGMGCSAGLIFIDLAKQLNLVIQLNAGIHGRKWSFR